MPNKIWIINADDCLFSQEVSIEGMKESSLKYILLLKPGDYCVLSPLVDIDSDFVSYMARIKKLKHKNFLFTPAKHDPSESLIKAISKDKQLVDKLSHLCRNGYVMVPQMYTKQFAALSRQCGNNLSNNYKSIEKANDKMLFKKVCKKFNITPISPVYKAYKGQKARILSALDFQETYLLRHPVSAGGYGTVKGKLLELIPLLKQSHQETDVYLERYKDIYRSLGTLAMLKEDGIYYGGVDCQIVHKEAWEGCFYPFTKAPESMLRKIKEKTLLLAGYYYSMGMRGQINIDWALRWKEGKLKLRALECNPRYNGFSICQRLASTVYNIKRDKLHFYLDTKMQFNPSWNTKQVISELEKLNKKANIKGGIVLTSRVKDGQAGFCFIGTSRQDIALLRRLFKQRVKELETEPRKRMPTLQKKIER